MRLYLETTVPNFLFANDAPEKRQVTEIFFNWLRVSSDELFVSSLSKTKSPFARNPSAAR